MTDTYPFWHPYFYNYAEPEVIMLALDKGYNSKLNPIVYLWDTQLLTWNIRNIKNRCKGDHKLTAVSQKDLRKWLSKEHKIEIGTGENWREFNKNIRVALETLETID